MIRAYETQPLLADIGVYVAQDCTGLFVDKMIGQTKPTGKDVFFDLILSVFAICNKS